MLAELPADDPAAAKLARLQQELAALQQQAAAEPGAAATAAQTLLTLLQNILDHPGEAKYRRVRLGNPAFARKAGRFAAAVAVLQLAGFGARQAEGGEQVVVLRRDDPGLLWLVLSGLRQALAAA